MYKKVLAEVNESIISENSARYALKFAKLINASFYLCFIHQREIQFEKAETILKRVFVEAEKNHLKVEGIIKEGERVKELKEIVKKEKIDLAFLPAVDLKKILKLPCSLVVIKIINMGKLFPKKILFILKDKISHLEEKTYFIKKFSEIFHAKVFIDYFGKDKNIDKLLSNLKKQEVKFESRVFSKFFLKTVIFQALSYKVDLLIIEQEKRGILEIFKLGYVTKLLENPPCNLIIFKPSHKK